MKRPSPPESSEDSRKVPPFFPVLPRSFVAFKVARYELRQLRLALVGEGKAQWKAPPRRVNTRTRL
eukprot:1349475-Amorphochlora_amoeboformis.AAC.1